MPRSTEVCRASRRRCWHPASEPGREPPGPPMACTRSNRHRSLPSPASPDVVAAQVMRLAEQGRLELDDPVADTCRRVPALTPMGQPVADLLAMESGSPDPALSTTAPDVLADPMRAWTARRSSRAYQRINRPPVDHFVYEDANYMLLGLVIEETTGMSLASALRSGVLGGPATRQAGATSPKSVRTGRSRCPSSADG